MNISQKIEFEFKLNSRAVPKRKRARCDQKLGNYKLLFLELKLNWSSSKMMWRPFWWTQLKVQNFTWAKADRQIQNYQYEEHSREIWYLGISEQVVTLTSSQSTRWCDPHVSLLKLTISLLKFPILKLFFAPASSFSLFAVNSLMGTARLQASFPLRFDRAMQTVNVFTKNFHP